MKAKFAKLDLSKLPENYRSKFEEIKKETENFTVDTDIFESNFNRLYALVEKNHTDAIEGNKKTEKGGSLKRTKEPKKPKARTKPEKSPEPEKPKKEKFSTVKEGEKEQEVAEHLTLKKVKDDVYTLAHKGKNAFDFEKKAGKWHVECKVEGNKKKEGFDSLNEAVHYVATHIYSAELKEYVKQKKDAAKRSKKFREKNPSGQTTPAKDVAKAASKAKEKLKEAEKEGKDTDKQQEAIINQIVELVKSLDPEYRKKLIAMLK